MTNSCNFRRPEASTRYSAALGALSKQSEAIDSAYKEEFDTIRAEVVEGQAHLKKLAEDRRTAAVAEAERLERLIMRGKEQEESGLRLYYLTKLKG